MSLFKHLLRSGARGETGHVVLLCPPRLTLELSTPSSSAPEPFQGLTLAQLALNLAIQDQLSPFLLPDFWPFYSLLLL